MTAAVMTAGPSPRAILAWQRVRVHERREEAAGGAVALAEADAKLLDPHIARGKAACGEWYPKHLVVAGLRRSCSAALAGWVAAAYAMKRGGICGTHAELARLVDACERAVRYALAELVDLGLVERVPRFELCHRGADDCHGCKVRGVGHRRETCHAYLPGPRLLAILEGERRRKLRAVAPELARALGRHEMPTDGSDHQKIRRAGAASCARPHHTTTRRSETLGERRAAARLVRSGGGAPVPVAALLATTARPSASPTAEAPEGVGRRRPPADGAGTCLAALMPHMFGGGICGCPRCAGGAS